MYCRAVGVAVGVAVVVGVAVAVGVAMKTLDLAAEILERFFHDPPQRGQTSDHLLPILYQDIAVDDYHAALISVFPVPNTDTVRVWARARANWDPYEEVPQYNHSVHITEFEQAIGGWLQRLEQCAEHRRDLEGRSSE